MDAVAASGLIGRAREIPTVEVTVQPAARQEGKAAPACPSRATERATRGTVPPPACACRGVLNHNHLSRHTIIAVDGANQLGSRKHVADVRGSLIGFSHDASGADAQVLASAAFVLPPTPWAKRATEHS